MDISTTIVNQVLTFWYGHWPFKQEAADKMKPMWFQSSEELDQEIKTKFESQVEQLLQPINTPAPLRLPEQLDDALAIIILLDQFTRNIYRGSGQAFAGDETALTICKQLIKMDLINSLPLDVAAFACMPLQHSESPEVQELSIKTFDSLCEVHGEKARGFANFARIHKEIIDNFGRYPHRNQALERASTDAELKYLNSDGHRFGQ